MSFKIINPGYGALISSKFTTVNGTNYNPRHGVAFYGDTDFNTGFTIPAINSTGTFYFKFDVYAPARFTKWAVNLFHGNGAGSKYTEFVLNYYVDDNYDDISAGFTKDSTEIAIEVIDENLEDWLNFGAVNTVWGYFTLSGDNDSCAITLNGRTILEETGKVIRSANQTMIQLYVPSKAPISNLIISDEYIDPNEVIVELGAAAVDTTMLADGENYSAIDTGEYVLQMPDTSNARRLFGRNGKILGLAAVATYTASENITKLKCRVNDGETVTDFSAQTLSSDTGAMLAEYLPVTSDTTVARLEDFKIGWVTE